MWDITGAPSTGTQLAEDGLILRADAEAAWMGAMKALGR